jgi:hypothetical protein
MTTSPYTFEDLATAEAQETIRAPLMASLLADGQPTASWAPSSVGGIENLRADMVAGGLAFYMAARIAAYVNGRVLPLSTDSPENGFFLTYLGLRFYKLVKRGATSTIQNIRLTVATTAGAQSFSDGDLWVASPATGNKYRLTLPPGEKLEIAPGESLDAPFQAENPGSSYSDAAGTITRMVTAKAGVTCINVPRFEFAPTRSTGSSSGTISGTLFGVTPPYSAVRVRIDLDGNIGAGAFSWSTNGGLTWTPGGPIPGSFFLPVAGRLFFRNGNATPSFLAGSIFTLRVDECFIQRGADAETDQAFRARCSNRHPARSLVPLKAHIELWAHAASPEVDKVASQADPNTPGGILVTIASAVGPATPAAQIAVEDYIIPRLRGFKGVPAPSGPIVTGSSSPEETIQASSAVRFQVQAAATISVARDQLAAAQAGADAKWNTYLGSLPLGGQPNASVEMERFYELMGELGAVDIQGLTLNAVAADLDIPVGQVAVPADGWTLLANVVWVTV